MISLGTLLQGSSKAVSEGMKRAVGGLLHEELIQYTLLSPSRVGCHLAGGGHTYFKWQYRALLWGGLIAGVVARMKHAYGTRYSSLNEFSIR